MRLSAVQRWAPVRFVFAIDSCRQCPKAAATSLHKCPFNVSFWPSTTVCPAQRYIRSWAKRTLCRHRRSVEIDPTVWTGRVLQVGSENLEIIGLALLYPALEWSVCAPGHHGYPRASDLILGKALRGRLGHQITGATGETVSPSPQSNSQTSGVNWALRTCAHATPDITRAS